MIVGADQQIHIPENTGKAQLVLILQVRSVTPFQNDHGEPVASLVNVFRDVELAAGVGNLAVAGKAAVDPQIVAGVHAVKVQINLLGGGPGVQGKFLHIDAGGIFVRHIGRVEGDGETGVGILVPVIPQNLPAAGYGNGIAAAGAGIRRGASLRDIVVAVVIAEAPVIAVQGDGAGCGEHVCFHGLFLTAAGYIISPERFRFHMQGLWILKIIG